MGESPDFAGFTGPVALASTLNSTTGFPALRACLQARKDCTERVDHHGKFNQTTGSASTAAVLAAPQTANVSTNALSQDTRGDIRGPGFRRDGLRSGAKGPAGSLGGILAGMRATAREDRSCIHH